MRKFIMVHGFTKDMHIYKSILIRLDSFSVKNGINDGGKFFLNFFSCWLEVLFALIHMFVQTCSLYKFYLQILTKKIHGEL